MSAIRRRTKIAAASLTVGLGFGCAGPDERVSLERGEVMIEYVGHACFRLHDADGRRIVIDPFGSGVWISYGLPTRDELEADASFVTHPHYDHDGGVSTGLLRYPFDDDPYTQPGTEYRVGRFSVVGIEGRHAKDFGEAFDHRNTIWRVQVSGMTIVHWGDNDADLSEIRSQLGEIDVLMLPVDGKEHLLEVVEIDRVIESLDPSVVIPMHYRLEGVEQSSPNELLLGNIDPWLDGHDGSADENVNCVVETLPDGQASECVYPVWPAQSGVVRLGGHRHVVARDQLPVEREIWVFEPSPDLRRNPKIPQRPR